MSEDNQQPPLSPEDELKLLKQRADQIGVEYSNNIGLETLRERVNNKLKTKEDVEEVNALDEDAKPKETLRQKIIRENMKLVRVRIQNLDPKKKDLPGEIFTVANEYLGTVRKFVPFGEATDDGYHVPLCIYNMMKNRKFLQIRTRRDRRTGIDIVETGWVREFSLEVLPQLTQAELDKLAAAQKAAGNY